MVKLAAGVVVCMLLVAGWGGSATAGAQLSGQAKKPVTISMFGALPDTVINVKTNWFTKYAEKRFHIKFTFDLVAGEDVATKQPLLLASGDYPSVIWNGSISQTDALKYGSQGVFLPLNGLLKKYAPNVWRQIHTIPGYAQDVTAPNGKIYALGLYNFCFHCYWTYNYYINLKYLNEFHLNMPKTTAQFSHALGVFKRHGLVPLTGSSPTTGGGYAEDVITYLMNAFIPYNGGSSYFDVKGNKVVFAPTTPQWRAGLEYIHSLYAKGYFSKVALTQQATAVENLVDKQKVGVFPNGAIETALPTYGAKGSHYLDWFTMPPLKGPKGVQSVAWSGGVSGLEFAITNKATKAQQIAILKLLNFMWTPKGAEMEDFGPSGKYWSPAKEGQEGLIPKQALFNTNWNEFYSGNSEQNEGWNQWGPIDQSEAWRNLNYATPPFAPSGSATNNQLTEQVSMAGHQPKWQYPPAVWVSSSHAQTYATEQTNIDNYVSQWTDEFVTGAKSLSSQWHQYVSGLRPLGLSDYVKVSQQAMGRPEDGRTAEYESSPSDIKYLLCLGTVPTLTKKYLLQEGVPPTDFACSK